MAGCMNTNQGVYKSTDGGTTWKRMLNETVYDMTINPNDENEWFVGVREKGIMYSSDGGVTWETRNNGLFGTYGRTSIKQSPTNPDILYVLMELNQLAVIAKSTNRGQSWTMQYNDSRGCFFSGSCTPESSQGFYDNYVSISPTNPDICFVGGIDIWRTTNGGTTWMNVTNGYDDGNGANLVHVDQHCLAFGPPGSGVIYAGNDGGMVKSFDGGTTWQAINNGLAITQFYDFDNDPTRRERSFGGTQDNGTLGTFGPIEWDSIWGGDGMVTIVHSTDPDIVYGNNPNGRPFRLNFRTQQARYITSGIDLSESALWAAPMVANPYDGNNLMHGRRRVWKSYTAGNEWVAWSPAFVNNVSAMAFSYADEFVLWAGSSTGEIMISEDDGNSWSFLERNELSNRFIGAIHTSYKNRETAWIGYGSYGAPNLWKTTDLGSSWTSVWGNMPDVVVNGIAVHPDDEDIIFIATDIGVFATFDGGNHWMPYGKGLPRTVVTGIRLNYEFGYLRCVTHGRSAWEVPLLSVAPTDPSITAPIGSEIFTGTLHTTISWTGFTPPVTLEYSVDDGFTWKEITTGVSGRAYRWQVPNWPTVNARIRITSVTTPSQQVVSNTFTIVPLVKGGVVSSTTVPWVPYGLAWDGKEGLWSSSFYTPYLYKLDRTTLQMVKKVRLPSVVGDSLFTDLTFDRSTGTIYLHKLTASDGVGATVIVVDTNGQLINRFPSQARRYATGLEYVNGNLIAGERDGFQNLYVMTTSGALVSETPNPCRVRYGPRCLASDDKGNLVQTCTNFPSESSTLSDCYAIRIPTDDLQLEKDRMQLSTNNGLINARGIEYDVRDGGYWVGDFSGNIYKITGFDFVAPPVTSVEESNVVASMLSVRPNPVSTTCVVSLSAVQASRSVLLSVRNILGEPVARIYRGDQLPGLDLVVSWPASSLAPGTYIVTAESSGTIVGSVPVIISR